MKVLIISDIHNNFKQMHKILNDNKDIDYKIFVGDFQTNIDIQKEYAKLFDIAIQGNCDHENNGLKFSVIKKIKNINIFVTHGHMFQDDEFLINFNQMFQFAKKENINLIIHGHDHIAIKEINDGITRFNPGSITNPRDNKKPSYGVLDINSDGTFNLKHIFI